MRRIGMAIATLVLGACGSGSTVAGIDLGVERYEGYYSQGFEVDAFRPCGSDEKWWVTDGTELRARYRATTPEPYEEVYVELRGTVTPVGSYGHLGEYRRELMAGEVLTLRAPRESDCD